MVSLVKDNYLSKVLMHFIHRCPILYIHFRISYIYI